MRIPHNIFVYGIIGWLVILLSIRRYINIFKHPLVLLACIYPFINLMYNYSKDSDEDVKYNDTDYMKWLFDRIQNNSLYIATAVFALNGITHSTLGNEKYAKVVPFYALTVFFGVCINLIIFYTQTNQTDITLSKFKSISLTYGITCMSIGIFYSLDLMALKTS